MSNITESSIIAIIPARAGSKGIPGKNKKEFLGKPLVLHTIDYALTALNPNHIYLSTDDFEIMDMGKKKRIEIIERPNDLAQDNSTTESAVEHVLKTCTQSPELILILQPTSPLRPENSLKELIDHFYINQFDSLLTISPTHRFFWQIDKIHGKPLYDIHNRPRRQDMEKENIRFVENGSVYAFTYEHFKSTRNRLGGKIGYYIFPEEYSIELDTVSDWTYLETIGNGLKNQL